MSLILKGIDSPKEDEWLEVIIKPSREVIVDTIRYRDNALLNTEYGSAIQIHTPHGRLGDLDKVLKGLEADTRETFTRHDVWLMLSKYNTNAPTILEAEE